MRRIFWVPLLVGVLIGALVGAWGAITFATLHPNYGETEKALLEKRGEALARLAEALSGLGTNTLQMVQ